MGPGEDADPAHEYFQRVEELFLRLRGAPLLLSPEDWQEARRWQRQGIPLSLVREVLEEVFARRAERGLKGRVNSLRYVAPAVEEAWQARRRLQDPARVAPRQEVPVEERLRALAGELPETLPEVDAWRRRILALAGEPEAVEEELNDLEEELMARLEEELGEEGRRELEQGLGQAARALERRLPATEAAAALERLRRQELRRRLGLPVLSLFGGEPRDTG